MVEDLSNLQENKMTDKKIVFWSPVDPKVKFAFDNNPSLSMITKRFPHIYVCSNDIDQEVREKVGHNAITINSENDMKLKGTVAIKKMREMDVDICIRLDIDAIVFDLDKLIELASRTKPKQLLGWKVKGSRREYVRGGCHAAGKYIIDNIAPLGFGSSFDRSMNKNVNAIGGELIDVRLFELNKKYTGESPVWHPSKSRKGKMRWHAELWKSMHAEPSGEIK